MSASTNQSGAATIAAAVFILQRLHDRATDPRLSYEAIEAAVDDIARRFDARGLVAVARAFGIRGGLTGKAAACRRIVDRIAERKGRHERGEVIDQVAHCASCTRPGVAS